MRSIHFIPHFDAHPLPAEAEQTEPARDLSFDLPMVGAWAAVLVWMVLFAGFLYSWFTMGQ